MNIIIQKRNFGKNTIFDEDKDDKFKGISNNSKCIKNSFVNKYVLKCYKKMSKYTQLDNYKDINIDDILLYDNEFNDQKSDNSLKELNLNKFDNILEKSSFDYYIKDENKDNINNIEDEIKDNINNIENEIKNDIEKSSFDDYIEDENKNIINNIEDEFKNNMNNRFWFNSIYNLKDSKNNETEQINTCSNHYNIGYNENINSNHINNDSNFEIGYQNLINNENSEKNNENNKTNNNFKEENRNDGSGNNSDDKKGKKNEEYDDTQYRDFWDKLLLYIKNWEIYRMLEKYGTSVSLQPFQARQEFSNFDYLHELGCGYSLPLLSFFVLVYLHRRTRMNINSTTINEQILRRWSDGIFIRYNIRRLSFRNYLFRQAYNGVNSRFVRGPLINAAGNTTQAILAHRLFNSIINRLGNGDNKNNKNKKK